jgi:hypothetical protein
MVPTIVHHIFHGAFCCSTQLTRYLEMLPHCFALREPAILTQLAVARQNYFAHRDHVDGGPKKQQWESNLCLCIKLLTRTYTAEDVVVIKPSDRCNSLGTELLKRDARSRILIISIKLRSYILGVLKREGRRSWIRYRLKGWKADVQPYQALSEINENTAKLHDAEASAYLWLINRLFWKELVASSESNRVRIIDGDEIALEPRKALPKVADLFGLQLSESLLDQMLESSVVGHYSKDTSRSYSIEDREEELAGAELHFGHEADRAVDWIIKIDRKLGLGLTEEPFLGY